MNDDLLILVLEAMTVYSLVLWSHSLRHRFGLAHFYALIGGITAVMSIEMYIQQPSEAEFSHGICPDCARSLYPEIETGESN